MVLLTKIKEFKMMIKALNPKHQKTVNSFIRANAKYDFIVDATDDNGGLKQERAYDKAAELFELLPKREQKNLGTLGEGY